MNIAMTGRVAAALVPLLLLSTTAAGQMRTYNSRYYVLHTDLPAELVREVDLHITAMAEMYAGRTKGFAGQITERFPFHLYRSPRDYYAAGGMRGSAGQFDGRKLMAIAGENLTDETWRIIQHEGFHQFVHHVMRGDFPIWVNEGMAEYFGEAIYTGHGFVTGVIPPARARRIKAWIDGGHTLSIKNMMTLTHEAWSGNLNVVNYDQAWSMIHFLAHAHGGRYQQPLNGFITDVSRGRNWEEAWTRNFGRGTREFERQWRTYWSTIADDATADLIAQASVATLTGFYARAFSQRQMFQAADEFFAAAAAGELKADARDWLPPYLLERELKRYRSLGRWQVRRRGGYELVCTLPSGVEVVGTFRVDGRRVRAGSVKAEIRGR